jgi:hypothetical protein
MAGHPARNLSVRSAVRIQHLRNDHHEQVKAPSGNGQDQLIWHCHNLDARRHSGMGSSHSAVEDPFEGPRVDPFSIMVNAKNLPSQQSFNFEDERCLATPIQSMERCRAFHASGD